MLVTGANGFVGRALCANLALTGHRVCGAIRQNASDGLSNDLEYVAVGDINEQTDWSAVLAGVESVIHLAARVHVMRDVADDPLAEFRRINVLGTMSLARQAAAAGVRRFVFISSIKVNGENTCRDKPYTADDVPAPVDPYGVSKHEAEQALRQLAKETVLEVVIIRPVMVYGPGVKGNFLSMMRWLHKGIPLPFGAIHNCRSLVALDNLVDLIMTCLHHQKAPGQTFLVSDGEDISTTALLQRMAAAQGNSARLIPVPEQMLWTIARMLGKTDYAQRLCGSLQVDISKTRELLGWTPPVSLDDALKRVAQHFLANQID